MAGNLPDDTQPKSPFKSQPQPQQPQLSDTQPKRPRLIQPEPEPAGPGCFVTGFIGLIIVGMALAIVGLSATAGWRAGQQIAETNMTATYQADVNTQLNAIAENAASGNYLMFDIRLNFLAQQTPALPQVPGLIQTGTALYLAYQPTATPTPTETPAPTTETTQEATSDVPTPTPPPNDPYNLPGRLEKAQRESAAANWPAAIQELDIIIRADPSFESTRVRDMMRQALNRYAQHLYQTGDPANLAEANALVDRAQQQFPPLLIESLAFERDIATMYLNAVSAIGTSDFNRAITNLEEVRRLASPNYLNGEPLRKLASVYGAFGDGLLMSQPCNAVIQYDNALRLFNDGNIQAKRITAQNYCDFGTPTPEGFVPTIDPAGGGAITPAPIGQ